MPFSLNTYRRIYSGFAPCPDVYIVLPLRSATELTLSPFSSIYKTPSVLTASISTLPSVLLQSVLATFVGRAAMSISPVMTLGTSSSGDDATVKL